MNLTLSEIASRIAELEGRDQVRVHMQLRNPAVRRLLMPVKAERGRTTAVSYAPSELIRARIASVLIDIGHDASTVEAALTVLIKPLASGFVGDKIVWPKSVQKIGSGSLDVPEGLPALVRGVASGERWELRVRFSRDHAGQRQVRSDLALSDWDNLSNDDSQMIAQSRRETHLGSLVIPLSELITPLLAFIAEG